MTDSSPDFDPETAVTVGRVLAPHGIRGEVKVESLTDFVDRFNAASVLWLDGSPVRIERGRWQRRALILKLEGIEDRTAAEALRGKDLEAPPVPRTELGQDIYYRDDLIGLEVVDKQGQPLGLLADILATGSNDVYLVRGARGELLLPATDDVVSEIDLSRRRIVVDVVEGLEWERSKASAARQRRKSRS